MDSSVALITYRSIPGGVAWPAISWLVEGGDVVGKTRTVSFHVWDYGGGKVLDALRIADSPGPCDIGRP